MAISGLIDLVQQNFFCASPILQCPLRCANNIGAVIFTLLTGEGRRIIKILPVRYHCGGSEELNSRILLLASMVYL
jgi:hypothetical protein